VQSVLRPVKQAVGAVVVARKSHVGVRRPDQDPAMKAD
jgi:hypothetical protein